MTTDFDLAARAVKPRLRETISIVVTAAACTAVYLVARPAYVAGSWVAQKIRKAVRR